MSSPMDKKQKTQETELILTRLLVTVTGTVMGRAVKKKNQAEPNFKILANLSADLTMMRFLT